MSSIRISPEKSTERNSCLDCNGKIFDTYGRIYKDNMAYATYLARWTAAHWERGIQMLISIEKHSPVPNTHSVIGVNCRMARHQPKFVLVDALPWHNDKSLERHFCGTALTRQQALRDPIAQEIFQMLDNLPLKDHCIRAFLTSNC